MNKLKEFNVNLIVKMASSYKFCVIATGEYDIYAAQERANEWDYAAGHAVAQNAGAIIIVKIIFQNNIALISIITPYVIL